MNLQIWRASEGSTWRGFIKAAFKRLRPQIASVGVIKWTSGPIHNLTQSRSFESLIEICKHQKVFDSLNKMPCIKPRVSAPHLVLTTFEYVTLIVQLVFPSQNVHPLTTNLIPNSNLRQPLLDWLWRTKNWGDWREIPQPISEDAPNAGQTRRSAG